MIRAGYEVAAAADTRFHIHVAEGQYEGQRTLAEHGATPIRYLDRLGVLGPRMIGVHCVWLDDQEVGLMAERGAGLAYCPSSNMILGDGITRITEMRRLGVRIGLGTDGGCTNNRLSVFEEMRMAALLQKVRHLDGTRVAAEEAFAMGTAEGAALLGVDAGAIEVGRAADLVAVDLEHPSLHPPTSLLKSVVYAMSHQAVTDVWVHGRAGRPRPAPRHPRSGRAHGAGARAHPRLEARVSGLTVRGAGPGDRDAIQAVTLAAYQEYAATIGAHWKGYRQNIIATLAAAAPGTQIVALDDDRVVGAVVLYPAGASIENAGRHHR